MGIDIGFYDRDTEALVDAGIARVVAADGIWDPAALAEAAEDAFAGQYTDLTTDLEAFNTEPEV